MKFFIPASLCLTAVFAASLQRRQEPQLPNLEDIFLEQCASDLLESCPDETAAAEPYLTGEAKELDITKFVEIALQLAKDKKCKAALPPCAGKVVEEALRQFLDTNVPDS